VPVWRSASAVTWCEGGGIQTLTISALEHATGVARSTIHYYIQEGLLPRPAKLAASRSLYSEHHLALLRRIVELKQAGLSLAEIKEKLRRDLEQIDEPNVDVAAREHERVHAEIVRIATREFVTEGYEATHVATIIKKTQTTPHVFYSHFTSKHHLLAECFLNLTDWNLRLVETNLAHESDLGRRLLARLASDFAVHALGSEVATLIHSEEQQTDQVRALLEESYARIVDPMVADLETIHPVGSAGPTVSPELLAYSLLGAFDNTQLRASWDDKYSRYELFRTHLWLFLAIRAVLGGRLDIDTEMADYDDLVREVAARKPEVPPLSE
jgi:DNA-binding transcriptional MerR regulator